MSSIAQTVDCPKCGAPLPASAGSATCTFGVVYFVLAQIKLQSALEAKWYPWYIGV